MPENTEFLAAFYCHSILKVTLIENHNFAGDDCDVGALVREEGSAHTYHRGGSNRFRNGEAENEGILMKMPQCTRGT